MARKRDRPATLASCRPTDLEGSGVKHSSGSNDNPGSRREQELPRASCTTADAVRIRVPFGPGEHYVSAKAAGAWCVDVIEQRLFGDLPLAQVVKTADAFEITWRLARAVPLAEWAPVTEQIAQVCRRHGLAIDRGATLDPHPDFKDPGGLPVGVSGAVPRVISGDAAEPVELGAFRTTLARLNRQAREEPDTEGVGGAAQLTMAEAAAMYARTGFPILPLYTVGSDGRCCCRDPDCKSPGKHPLTKHGLKEASTDLAVVERWWIQWPSANIGLATGGPSGLVVLDIDGEEGEASLRTLVAERGALPNTLSVRTGKGRHLYFRREADDPEVPSRAGIRPGLDVRSEGGHVVAPPSVHATGRTYEWGENKTLARPPKWLLEVIGRKSGQQANDATARSLDIAAATIQAKPAYSGSEADRVRSALAAIPADDRDIWLVVGAALHWTGWGQVARLLWDEWSRASSKFDPADQDRTWASFDRPYRGRPVTLGTLFMLAQRHGWRDPASSFVAKLAPDAPSPAPGSAQAPEDGGRPTPGAPDLEDTEIVRLAALPLLRYAQERKVAAKRLGCPIGILDKLVATARPGAADDLQGQPLDLPSPQPWPEPVDGDAVLDEISMLITQHVVMHRVAANAVALWVLHTYLLDAAQATPRLAIKSPEKRCGKTTLLSLIRKLVQRPLPASNVSPAALFRAIEAAHPTLLIDEADTFIAPGGGQHTPVSDELRGIINSGHTRDMAYVVRIVGEAMEPRKFSTWAAMALAAIGRLPGTIEDRAIVISLRRRRPDEPVARHRHDRDGHIRDAARRAARWAADHAAEIACRDPDVPTQLNDRAADNWRPLLAIADAAGGDWPERARAAAIELSADGALDQESTRTALLADIRTGFEAKGVDRISSEELVGYLASLEDRPWAEFGKSGKAITKNQLARLLRDFKIAPSNLRLDSERVQKGYYLSAFEEAFARYLPADPSWAPLEHTPF
ncbi:unnamed protein product [uncultured bacterium]|nr:unnamed protein product [uncultured bacterium]